MGEVGNYGVRCDIHADDTAFCGWASRMLDRWDSYKTKGLTLYSGSACEYYYTFLMALHISDFVKIGCHKVICDHRIDGRLRQHDIQPIYHDHVKAIHQAHGWARYRCPVMRDCEHYEFCKRRYKL
jgi:hypothetical protein